MKEEFIDDKGNLVLIDNGYVFINGSCVAEPGSDADFDRYAVQVMNGDGFYNSCGSFVSFGKE